MDLYQENIYQLFGPKSQDCWPNNLSGLPESYLGNGLVLMPVEPGKAYAYWDLCLTSSAGQNDVIKNSDENPVTDWQEGGLVIKIYEATTSEEPAVTNLIKECLVDLQCRSLFFDLNWQTSRYQAELVFFNRQGLFLPIALSNFIGLSKSHVFKKAQEPYNLIPATAASPGGLIGKRFYRKILSPLTAECELKFRTGISSRSAIV
jgi:hypothetical protein